MVHLVSIPCYTDTRRHSHYNDRWIGYALGPLLLILHVLTAGVLTLLIRFIASWGGPISRAFGSFGSQPFSQALGWALIPISLWCLVNGVFYASDIGVLSVFNG